MVDESILDAMGTLMTIIGRQAEINVYLGSNINFV